jgi:hypothetical protein
LNLLLVADFGVFMAVKIQVEVFWVYKRGQSLAANGKQERMAWQPIRSA